MFHTIVQQLTRQTSHALYLVRRRLNHRHACRCSASQAHLALRHAPYRDGALVFARGSCSRTVICRRSGGGPQSKFKAPNKHLPVRRSLPSQLKPRMLICTRPAVMWW